MRFFKNCDREIIELRSELVKFINEMEARDLDKDVLIFGTIYNDVCRIYKKILSQAATNGVSETNFSKYKAISRSAKENLRV